MPDPSQLNDPKWEYLIENLEHSKESAQITLDECGALGWELVSVTSTREGTTAYFKRLLPPETEEE